MDQLRKFREFFRKFYEEKGEGDGKGENLKLMASGAEIFLFFATFILSLIYVCNILWWDASLITGTNMIAKRLVPLIPTLLWVFMRASRKNMDAAATLAAGLFGGGAIGAIVAGHLMGG